MRLLKARMVFTLAVAALSVTAFLPSAEARPVEKIKKTGDLRVVVYREFKPFSWEEDGKAKGIDADISREIAKALGVRAKIFVRTAGEEVDDDVRSNIWQGPRTGGLKGDIMFHIPMDKVLVERNDRAIISNGYYHEEYVLVVNTDKVDKSQGLKAFKDANKVAVEFSTAGHYFLAFTEDQALQKSVSPYMKFQSAVDSFKAGESAGIVGRRAQVEHFLKDSKIKVETVPLDFPDTLRSKWNVGIALATDSKDLEAEITKVLADLTKSGKLAEIFKSYGVTLVTAK